MKRIIVVLLIMAFTLTFGSAVADQMPTLQDRKDVGAELYLGAFPTHGVVIGAPAAKDFSTKGPIAAETLVDAGTALYNSAFPVHKPMLTEKSAEGAGAGGVGREDENIRIWDNLLSPPAGSLE